MRKSGSGDNVFRRGKIWWARVIVDGKEIRRSLSTNDRAEARDRLSKLLPELTRGRVAAPAGAGLVWQDAVVRYVQDYGGSLKARTLKRYTGSFKQLHDSLYNVPVAAISARTVADIVSRRRKDGVSNSTIRRDLTAMSRVLAASIAWGEREDNPAKAYDKSLIREKRPVFPQPIDKDVDTLVRRAGQMFGALIVFLRHTGARSSEGAQLEWPEIDLRRRQATFIDTKTKNPRTINLAPETVATLKKIPRHSKSDYVFWHGPNGRPYSNVSSRFFKLVRDLKANKKITRRFRCHDLRHGYAIAELKRGRSIYNLSRHLGHTSVKTTEIYLRHLTNEELERVRRASDMIASGKAAKAA